MYQISIFNYVMEFINVSIVKSPGAGIKHTMGYVTQVLATEPESSVVGEHTFNHLAFAPVPELYFN